MNAPTTAKRISTLDVPGQQVPADFDGTFWNSDTIAELLRDIGLDYIAVCPGSSFRGLHESLVNHLGNARPEMLLCLHEENAVAIAHGYARVTGKPMGVIVHCNVGLMHATMAVYNAWCDRMPVLILGGTGPLDSARRRTPIDWLHSVSDQAALVRNYVKWDDTPLSPNAAVESVLRGMQMATAAPKAPVYITLDQRLQEDSFPHPRDAKPNIARYRAPASPAPDPQLVAGAAALLAEAKSPVILAGRVSRDESAWAARVQLAEMLGARVLTDLKVAGAFPTDHPLHGPDPAIAFTPDEGVQILHDADVVLSLDWWDQATLFRQAWGEANTPATVIRCSLDNFIHRGWTRDHMGLTAVDLDILAEPDRVVPALLRELEARADDSFRQRAAERLKTIIIDAFIVHGVDPGPQIFQNHARLVYGIFTAMALANVFNLVIGQLGLRLFAVVVSFPNYIIHPVVIALCIAGAYATNNSMFAVGVALVFAVVGYFMRKLDFSFAAFIIGFALEPQMELFTRQTVILFSDKPAVLLEHPIVLFFLALTVYSIWRIIKHQRAGTL